MSSTSASQPRSLQDEVGKKAPFDVPEQEAYLNLVRTYAELHGQFERLFKEYGLSDPQYNALRIVAAAGPEGILSETIGERMVARAPDTTRLIDRLEKAGLVERSRGTEDRRCVLVTITGEGRRKIRQLDKGVVGLHGAQLGHLTRKQLSTLNRLLFLARHP
jgi:DNA-binding MarR family transcriptional regulator